MTFRASFSAGLSLFGSFLATVSAAEPPKPWPPDAFLPLTENRIAALPAPQQPAWRAYWAKHLERAKLAPARDLVDHSSTKPLAGPPIGSSYSKGVKLGAPAAWYASEEARVIADHVVNWQTPAGGWVKSGDYSRDRRPDDDHHDAWNAGTFDNDSTLYELRFLGLVQAAMEPAQAKSSRAEGWRSSFVRGLEYVLVSQYPNGGFPQIYPLVGWYHDAITFNDDAFVHILELCRDVADRKPEFAFVSPGLAKAAGEAQARGLACVLVTQLRDAHGQRTVWGQQHDPLTEQPCAARNFEPVSECSLESAGLVQYLMTIKQPSPEVVAAVEGAMQWFSRRAMHGTVWNRDLTSGSGLEPKAGAPDLWARFYEIETGQPVFGERDRMIHYQVTELSLERRKGYGWFNNRASALPALYAAWKKGLASAE